jgi:hypothetical protein
MTELSNSENTRRFYNVIKKKGKVENKISKKIWFWEDGKKGSTRNSSPYSDNKSHWQNMSNLTILKLWSVFMFPMWL